MHGLYDPLNYAPDCYSGQYYDFGPGGGDLEWYYDQFVDQYTPAHTGGTQPKWWWTFSRKDSSMDYQLRRRQRDNDIKCPATWNHGRDLPESWEARGRGKNRQLKRQAGENWYQFSQRAAVLQKKIKRANPRKARLTIRQMKAPDLEAPFSFSDTLDEFVSFEH